MWPNCGLESVSLVEVNAYRLAELIMETPKTKCFLMSIQVFLVFIQVELTWNTSLNTTKKILTAILTYEGKAEQFGNHRIVKLWAVGRQHNKYEAT